MAVIEVKNLVQDYGHGRGVFDVSFSVEKGQVFGFLGPNGAGKSTTIRHIMGFSRPQAGETQVFGKESFSSYDKINGNVGYIPGEIAFPAGLSGTELIEMLNNLRGKTNPERLKMLLDRFKLDPEIDTKKMSLGEKRKLAIVLAFMHDPDLLVLDEPTSGLDPVMQQVFVDFVLEEKKRGKTILLSSHIFSEIESTCDQIVIIKNGKIVSKFHINDIKHSENKLFKIGFASLADLQKFCLEFDVATIDKQTLVATVPMHDGKVNDLTNALSKCDIVSFSQEQYTLEDYFMAFYKEDKNYGGQL